MEPVWRSQWEAAYREYRSLQERARSARWPIWADLLESAAQGCAYLKKRIHEAEKAGLRGRLPTNYARALFEIAAEQDRAEQVLEQSDRSVYEDVYHAAFLMLRLFPGCPGSFVGGSYIFRGQSDVRWRLEASVYRGEQALSSREQLLSARRITAQNACGAGKAVAASLDVSIEQARAIAKHYAAELNNAPSWYLDFSYSPWVALFFSCASDPANRQEGALWAVRMGDYTRMTAHCASPRTHSGPGFGWIEPVELPEVPRVVNQHALFIAAPPPDLFEQYLPFPLRVFKQRPGLYFEDHLMGINANRIYPRDDPLRAKLQRIGLELPQGCAKAAVCDIPEYVFSDATDPSIYESILRYSFDQWRGNTNRSSRDRRLVLDSIRSAALFRARLSQPDTAWILGNAQIRSIARLHGLFGDLVENACAKRNPDPSEAIWHEYVVDLKAQDKLSQEEEDKIRRIFWELDFKVPNSGR